MGGSYCLLGLSLAAPLGITISDHMELFKRYPMNLEALLQDNHYVTTEIICDVSIDHIQTRKNGIGSMPPEGGVIDVYSLSTGELVKESYFAKLRPSPLILRLTLLGSSSIFQTPYKLKAKYFGI
jgi:hypothetical protein